VRGALRRGSALAVRAPAGGAGAWTARRLQNHTPRVPKPHSSPSPTASPKIKRTHTVWRSVNPEFNEWFELLNVSPGTRVTLAVFDKDTVSADDPMGAAEWVSRRRAEAGC
jgi:hypothetical protein